MFSVQSFHTKQDSNLALAYSQYAIKLYRMREGKISTQIYLRVRFMAVFKVKIDIRKLGGIVYCRGDAQSANGNGRNLALGDL